MLAGRGAVDTYVDARSVGATREAAFLGAVEGNLDRLFSTAYRLTRDRAEAEELVQETLLRAWAGLDPGRDAREVLAFVYRILVNLARDRGRRRAVVDLRPTDPRTLPEEKVPASDLEVLRQLTAAEVRRALDALPERYRLPVLLVDIDGFTYAEVAFQLGVPAGTVASRLRRGRLLLRRALWRAAAVEGIASDPLCREAGSLLAAYCRGEASEPERLFVENHLARCLPCRGVERVEREVRRLVRERACREPAPPALVAFLRTGPWRWAAAGARAPGAPPPLSSP
jgi:RNA polymerase sigma-70 factor (ECF subfamily)